MFYPPERRWLHLALPRPAAVPRRQKPIAGAIESDAASNRARYAGGRLRVRRMRLPQARISRRIGRPPR